MMKTFRFSAQLYNCNTERQDVDVDTAENLINPLLIFTAVLGFQLGNLLIGEWISIKV